MEPDKRKGIELNPALPVDKRSNEKVRNAFKKAGLTGREMTALLGGLLTLQQVEKTRTMEDWRQSANGERWAECWTTSA